ncbi:tyrosine-type recombinase/integrase [Rosistilla oblonga]|uniref:tyrosine-type recombinase/integrase n=1 Tax=Rosistilla oblonga TaxID=2527990 RepID=UPI003A97EC51
MSSFRPQGSHNSADMQFADIPIGKDEGSLFARFLDANDFSANTRKAMGQDFRKFARWFADANKEPLVTQRVTTRDVTDFKDHLRRLNGQAVNTVNRCLVTLRRYFGWLVDQGQLRFNVAEPIKELKRQQLAPKGMERKDVRHLLRELELRQDVRPNAIFHLFLYTGCRVGDIAALEVDDLQLSERAGTFRFGKGAKERWVPLPLPARRALQSYLEVRPPVASTGLFIGERGPLSESGIRQICDKYSAIIGVHIHPHLLRHTMVHQYLEDNPGDLVGLAQILGHENLNTTKRYVQKSKQQLADAADRITY